MDNTDNSCAIQHATPLVSPLAIPLAIIAKLEACADELELLHASLPLAHLQSAIDQLKIQFNLTLTTFEKA